MSVVLLSDRWLRTRDDQNGSDTGSGCRWFFPEVMALEVPDDAVGEPRLGARRCRRPDVFPGPAQLMEGEHHGHAAARLQERSTATTANHDRRAGRLPLDGHTIGSTPFLDPPGWHPVELTGMERRGAGGWVGAGYVARHPSPRRERNGRVVGRSHANLGQMRAVDVDERSRPGSIDRRCS